MNRRRFLQVLAGTTAAAPFASAKSAPDSLGPVLPQRELGNSGIRVTCLGLGGFHIGWTTESLAQATIEAALEEGVRFFDTAESYGPHTSEERYGRYLTPRYREHIFLMTKSMAKDAATARRDIEESLRRLATDHLDLWQIHSLFTPEDVDERLQAGVLDEALKARAEGKIRHIGFTGHASPYAHLRMLECAAGQAAFLTCQYPVNPVDAASSHSFIDQVLPALQKTGISSLAMKTLADGRFFGRKVQGGKVTWESANPVVPGALSVADCIHFSLSLPVSVLITGAENPEFLREKAALVRSFHQMTAEGRQAVIERVASFATEGKVEYYKAKELRLPA
ncbi:MAG: aldo/keto reductase [Terrimicrobiaceae bacterium]